MTLLSRSAATSWFAHQQSRRNVPFKSAAEIRPPKPSRSQHVRETLRLIAAPSKQTEQLPSGNLVHAEVICAAGTASGVLANDVSQKALSGTTKWDAN